MAAKEEVVVPEAAFVSYRLILISVWTGVGVGSFVWILPLGRGENAIPIQLMFLAWALLVLVIGSAYIAWAPVHSRSLRYVFEADRLVAHGGVWYHSRVFIPYARITDLTVRQGPLERKFGIHRVSVQTAGSSLPEAILLGIGDPDRVREILLQKGSVVNHASGDGALGAAPSA